MDWNQTYHNLRQLIGLKLQSISGRSDIRILDVDPDAITLEGSSGKKRRPTSELKQIVSKMDIGEPIHVDSILFGSGSSRNQPETILANMPDVEWLNLNDRKHIVWLGHKTHEPGTLKEIEAFQASEIRARFRGRGALTGRRPTSLLIRAKEARLASELVMTALQVSAPTPLPGKNGYRISDEHAEVLLVADPRLRAAMEVVPVLKVVDQDEAVERLRKLFPELKTEDLALDRRYVLVHLPNGSGIIGLE